MTTDNMQVAHDEFMALLKAVSRATVDELERRLLAGEVDGGKYGLLLRKCGCVYGTAVMAEGLGKDDPDAGYAWIRNLRKQWPRNERGHTALEDLTCFTIRPGEVADESRTLVAWIAEYRQREGG